MGSLCLATAPARGQGSTPVTPPSANHVTGFFKQIFSLWDVTDQQNWVVYAAISTFLYYKFFYKTSLATASAARTVMLKRLIELRVSDTERQRLLAEVDKHIEELTLRIPRAEKAAAELDQHIKNIRKGKRAKSVTQNFDGLADFHKLEQWLASAEAKGFLESTSGKNWKATYDGLKDLTSGHLDEPLSKIIAQANALYPNETFQTIQSKPSTEGGRPGDFVVRNDFTHRTNPIRLNEISGRVQNMRARCLEPLQAASGEAAQLTRDSAFWRYWTRPKNVKIPLLNGIVATTGLVGTYWLHRVVGYEGRQAEIAAAAKQRGDAAADIAGTLSTPEGRVQMKPYYEIIRDVVKTHRNELAPMVISMLEFDPKLPESREKALKFIDETLTSEAFTIALEQAVIAAAKKKQGDRVTREALLQMIDNAKKEKAVREGIFRPFTKEVVRGLVNNLWSHLTVNDPSEDFEKGVLGSILKRTEWELSRDPSIQPPPQQLVPPAPGVIPAGGAATDGKGAVQTNPPATDNKAVPLIVPAGGTPVSFAPGVTGMPLLHIFVPTKKTESATAPTSQSSPAIGAWR